jgi:hypothetical protein
VLLPPVQAWWPGWLGCQLRPPSFWYGSCSSS